MSILKKTVAALALVGVVASPAVVSAQNSQDTGLFPALNPLQIAIGVIALVGVVIIIADDDSDSK